jgi:hypothetical protein
MHSHRCKISYMWHWYWGHQHSNKWVDHSFMNMWNIWHTDPLLGSVPHTEVEVLLDAVFSMWSILRPYHTSSVSPVHVVEWSEFVGE